MRVVARAAWPVGALGVALFVVNIAAGLALVTRALGRDVLAGELGALRAIAGAGQLIALLAFPLGQTP